AAGKRLEFWDEKLPGFGLRVTEKGVKSWSAVYRVKGRWRRFTIGTHPQLPLADARKLAKGVLRDAGLGNDPAEQKQAARDADTFGELAQLYLDRHAKINKRSWGEDERIIDHDLKHRWGNRKAADIARRDVIALLDEIVARGSGVMANRVRALISKIFNFAIGRGIVEHNPAYRVPRPGQEHQRERFLSADEIRKVWNPVDSESPKFAAAFRLALLTAQRKSEVLGMTWSELDLEGGWWTIPGERTKNKLAHRVPLGPQALAILREQRKMAKEGATFVFSGGKRELSLANLQKPMRRLKEATKVDFKFHDLRRTAATHMGSLCIPRLVISKILNHVERSVTAIYDRSTYDSEKKAALLKWDRRLAVIIAGKDTSKVVAIRR
ncbi:MAG TPA: tyrosine-type recombinase/integrase, partial [Candidatus Binataceae bacterium]|nr:tyrosine-type recombinase/integrase [Candidatus Binataceae bacterium]